MTTPNTYRVKPQQWNKRPEIWRSVFNSLYRLMRDNQKIFMHPKAEAIPKTHWTTIAWNAAWEAADAARGAGVTPAGSLIEDITRTGKVVRTMTVQ